jgi:hypothetical protein
MARRDHIFLGIVEKPVVLKIEHFIDDTVRKRLAEATHAIAILVVEEILDALLLDSGAVDVEHAVLHLDSVAGKADDALDIVGRIILRQAEHHHVAALRLGAENAAGEQRRRQRQRIMAVAVAVFRDEQIVADQQGGLHRSRRNIERLEQQRSNHERDEEGVDDDAPAFDEPALFAFAVGGYAHWPLILRLGVACHAGLPLGRVARQIRRNPEAKAQKSFVFSNLAVR